jgi:hypothetical protein
MPLWVDLTDIERRCKDLMLTNLLVMTLLCFPSLGDASYAIAASVFRHGQRLSRMSQEVRDGLMLSNTRNSLGFPTPIDTHVSLVKEDRPLWDVVQSAAKPFTSGISIGQYCTRDRIL